MPRGRSATYDDQRDMILERAAQLFARLGYPSTSMNQVAEACKLSKATLYRRWNGKVQLVIDCEALLVVGVHVVVWAHDRRSRDRGLVESGVPCW